MPKRTDGSTIRHQGLQGPFPQSKLQQAAWTSRHNFNPQTEVCDYAAQHPKRGGNPKGEIIKSSTRWQCLGDSPEKFNLEARGVQIKRSCCQATLSRKVLPIWNIDLILHTEHAAVFAASLPLTSTDSWSELWLLTDYSIAALCVTDQKATADTSCWYLTY